jgi:hypothetical protein
MVFFERQKRLSNMKRNRLKLPPLQMQLNERNADKSTGVTLRTAIMETRSVRGRKDSSGQVRGIA